MHYHLSERSIVHVWNQFWKGGHLMGLKRVSTALAALFILSAGAAYSAELSGRSSTQFLWYNNDLTQNRDFETAEYLRIGITNIDPAGKFSLFGYGRGTQVFGPDNQTTGRIYSLYGEYRDFYDVLDVKLGRQFVNYAAGSALIDGVELNLKKVGPIGFSLMGGRDVVFGTKGGELSHSNNWALGLSGYLSGYPKTDLELSWFRKWDRGDVSRDFVGGMLRQYMFGAMKIYGDARYDLASEVFSEVHAGVKYFPMVNLVLTAEWYQSYPTFDTTSIYSVFAVDRFRQSLCRVDYTINDKIAIYGGSSWELYGEDASANVYHIGTKLRPINELMIDVSYDKRHGFGGHLDGVTLGVNWDATKELQLAGGFSYDEFTRDYLPTGGFNDNAQKYWVGGKYKFAKKMSSSIRVEDDINVKYTHDVQGRLIFDYDF